jgi:phage gp37-like protein
MIVDLDQIDEGVIDTIKANVSDLKTVDAYEGSFDEQTLDKMLLLSPFALVRFIELGSLTDQRENSGKAIVKGLRMLIVVGARSLSSKRAGQKGNYKISAEIDALLDGKRLTIDGNIIPAFEFESYKFAFSYKGTSVYFLTYTMAII